MNYKKELFEKQMTRKDFLRLMVVAALSLVGLGNLFTFLREHSDGYSHNTATARQPATNGFGPSKFGV